MRTPSPSWCRLDLAPPLADRFIFGVAPIDYSPVLLLMPFGFHLAVDTLPSGNRKRWLQVRLGCVRLSPSCPFRLLHTFLLSRPARNYPRLRIQRSSSERRGDFNPHDSRAAQRTLWRSLTPHVRASSATAPRLPDADQIGNVPVVGLGVSRFPRKELPHMPVSSTTPGRPSACVTALGDIAFRYTDSVGTRNQFSIAAQWLACALPYRRFADILADACARLGAD